MNGQILIFEIRHGLKLCDNYDHHRPRTGYWLLTTHMLDRSRPRIFCTTRSRKRPAVRPSTMRWSNDRHRFIMARMAMASSTTTGRFTMAFMARMAACGWLITGVEVTTPKTPTLLTV